MGNCVSLYAWVEALLTCQQAKGRASVTKAAWHKAHLIRGVFLHYSYIPPNQITHNPPPSTEADSKIPPSAIPRSSKPAAIFLPLLTEAAEHHGGFPSWLGDWWARWGSTANPTLSTVDTIATVGDDETKVSDGVPRRATAGNGRIWAVKGKQWTEVSLLR